MSLRPTSWDLPLFLHVLGAMALFGAVLATLIVSLVARQRPDAAVLRRAAWAAVVAVAIPAFVVMRLGAQWIYSKEGKYPNDPTWIKLGFNVADGGLLVLLISAGVAFWWKRSASPVAGRILAGLSSVYLLMLALAWLAMSGKWG